MFDQKIRQAATPVRALGAWLVLPFSLALLIVAAMVAAAPAWAAGYPPPGRAYELVSPVDDPTGGVAGLSTDFLPLPARPSEDGDRILYGAGSVPGTTWSGPTNPMIFGRRTPTGWVARNAIRSVDEGNTPLQLSQHEAQSGWMTSDGTEFVFGSEELGSAPSSSFIGGVYRTMDAAAPPDWLSRPNIGDALPGVLKTSVTAADDTRTVAFSSTAPLTSDAPAAGTSAVYVRTGGELRLVSRLPDGSVPSEETTLANTGPSIHNGGRPPAVSMRNQLADGGRFVLFAVHDPLGSELYVRDLQNEVTHQLAGGGSGAPSDASDLARGWGGAGQSVSADGITVPGGMVFAAQEAPRTFFKARAGLSVPGVLYEANLETGAVTERTAITGPPLGLSADGRRMIFLEPPASGGDGVGDWTLRFWDAADPETSAAIGTVTATSSSPPFGLVRMYRSSADGSTWIFTAAGSPDPSRPNVAPETQQLYRWSVGDDHPTCLSCEPIDGVARTSGVSLTPQEQISTESFLAPTTATSTSANPHKVKIAQPGYSVSDDGRWLLFDSPDRLVPEDRNDVRDVYLWDRDGGPGGELQLVTRGVGGSPAYALDLDPTGRNAFFSTRDGLVPADVDGAYDVYTARIGGGFPDGSPESCVGEACRPAAGAPAGPAVGSAGFVGHGNAEPPPKRARAAIRVSRRRVVVGRAGRLRVRVSGAGRVVVRGRLVRRTRRSARRAGAYTVRVALKRRARRVLARRKRGRLRVAVRVVYRSVSNQRAARKVRVTFKQPKHPKRAKRAKRKGGR